MPQFCAVVGCARKSGTAKSKNLSFFRFPSENDCRNRKISLAVERRKKWIAALKRSDLTESKIKYGRICSRHFISGKPAELYDQQNPDWVPSLNMGYEISKSKEVLGRYDRVKSREAKKQEQTNINDTICTSTATSTSTNTCLVVNTDSPIIELSEFNEPDLNKELESRNAEIYRLRQELFYYTMDIETFRNNDAKTLFYTGIPTFRRLTIIINTVLPYMSDIPSVSKFQQCLITFMKLRLNLLFTDLGYRFKIHRTTASRIFYKVISIFYQRFRKCIIWPSREILHKTMPKCFKENFGNKITIIIDCFETFTEKPSNLCASSQTWSSYKHHNTVKFLIGITPSGAISFISDAYGGRASDKFISETSGLLDNLLPGDVILADRGFLISESVGLHMAQVITPSFLKGKKQLESQEIEKTRKIANVRIHVERVIGVVKLKYTILANKLSIQIIKNDPNEHISKFDQIVTVCCALTNFCPPLVPL